MQRLTSRLCLLSALLLALSCLGVGCAEGSDAPLSTNENTSDTETSASNVSIRNYEKLLATSLADDPVIGPWLADAMARKQISNALLCSERATDGSRRCYLYVGSFCEGDTLAFGFFSGSSTLLIRHTASDVDALGSPFVFSFWVDGEEMPDVELFQNDVSAGIILSLVDGSINE